jgi:heterodisulfide reductase subunit A-like polyferredoxin
MIKSDFIAKTDLDKCNDCGECESWCYFGGREFTDNKLHFNPINCFGCGICVSKCPSKAITLISKTLSS